MISIMKREHSLNWIHLLMCIFCISWLNSGFVAQLNFINFMMFIGVFGFWGVLAISQMRLTMKISNIWLYIYAVTVFLSSVLLDSFWNKQTYAVFYIIIMCCFTAFYLQEERRAERKVLWIYYLFECGFMALKTAYICFLDPLYARLLAGGAEVDESVSGFMIAHFDNVYTFVLLSVFLIAVFPKSKCKKWICLLVPIFFICLYFANFATATIIAAVFVVLMFFVHRPYVILILACVGFFAFFGLRDQIADAAQFLAHQEWLSEFLQGKMQNVADTLNGVTEYQTANTLYMRMEYTEDAINVFLKHPLWGIYGINEFLSERTLLRDHNVWFDLLAYYGVIRILPFLLFICRWFKLNKTKFEVFRKSPLSFVLILWIFLGFVNPVHKQAIHILLFVMIPLSDVLFEKEKQ